jgi:hypothetical protein
MKFPKEIKIVIAENSNGHDTLEIEDYCEPVDGDKVAIYELKRIKTMRISKTLE